MMRSCFLPIARTAALVLALLAPLPAGADFEAGQRAWDAGSVDEALSQWRSAADEGDRRAMLALGRLHLEGLGVLQDYVEAHKWLNLAASRGEAAALGERDALAAKMTPAQIATAQERAAAWRPGGRSDGDAPDTTAAQGGTSSPAPASSPDARRPPPRAIREAQALLASLGYRPGPADGIWGRRTGAAYRAFLRDAGLPQAETLTPQALRALRVVAERRGVTAEADRAAPAAAGTAQAPAPSEASAPRLAPAVRPDALHRAAQVGDIEVLKAALAAGVDVDARDGQGWTALMHAVNKGYPLLVEPLLAAGAGVDVRAPDGATALFIATVREDLETIALLVKAGADVSIPGPQGKTPPDVARIHGGGVLLRALGVLQVGDTFRDCEACPLMVVVPSGSYEMGSPSGEDGRDVGEGPLHRVTIPEPFAVGVYEVTFSEWDACRRDGGCTHNPGDRGWGRGDRPVINVSWEDAKDYVGWLSGETGEEYRLLSESEWEYAARAGTSTRYWWGDEGDRNRENCNGCGSRWDGEQTVLVGSFSANGFGLYDVHGNVWEWVEDCRHVDYAGAPSDGSAWIAGSTCSDRVLRGGSWGNDPWNLRSASRGWDGAGDRYDLIGFRVASTLD